MKKSIMISIGIIALLITIFLILQNHSPEFFDIFGIIFFSFLGIVSFRMLKYNKLPSQYIIFFILIISILGLIVDGFNVIKSFILGG